MVSRRLEHGGKVFLSAPVQAETRWIRAICEEFGMSVASLSDLSFGATVRDQLAAAIAESDLVIALLLDEESLGNVGYEVGVAHGLDKPTLIVADPSGEIPIGLLGQQIVLNDDSALDAIRFWLRQFLDSPPRQRKTRTEPPPPQPKPERRAEWHDLSDSVRSAWRSGLHSEVEAKVAEALTGAGVEFLAQPAFGHSRPDFAAWVDDVEGVLGNPFVIEVKGSLRGRADQDRAFDQVSRYLNESNSRWALVLFMDGPKQPFARVADDRRVVLFQRFDEFARSLTGGDFASVVKQIRNRAVHGKG